MQTTCFILHIAIACRGESTEIPFTKNSFKVLRMGFTPDGKHTGGDLLGAEIDLNCHDGPVFSDETVTKKFKCVQNGSVGRRNPLQDTDWFGCRCMLLNFI